MKIVVAVCVYNRLENVRKWINAWKQRSETRYVSSVEKTVRVNDTEMPMIEITKNVETQLIIIHNYNCDDRIGKAVTASQDPSISFIHRENKGMDIGAVQDIFKERLHDFPNDWDYILWCADDTIPVQKNFIQQYLDTIQLPETGCACMKISPYQTTHIRTSGWIVSKETSRKIVFPKDPVTTRQECYQFEHKGGKLTLLEQIRNMGLDVRQVAPDATAPLWDSGYWRRLDRGNEYYRVFGGQGSNDKVVFIATIYKTFPALAASLIMQTHGNWELILIHDGKANDIAKMFPADPRIRFIETETRQEKWGHPNRQWALKNLDKLSDAAYVVITNSDNYYAPVFCEWMLKAFNGKHAAVAVYCDEMVHSYKAWRIIPVKFEKGFIDCGGVMVKREVAMEIGWRDVDDHSADWTYFSDIAAAYNLESFIPVKGCLLTHN